eukprot:TRINITY_DN27489_c0_g1_i1.p1 TRINITY_DN27489_c0_g1~~TRINITY_DN27489_c0_g1_i1.p1  ORF type:complete len:674 (+),score=110.27 TRINITY_DN27489_c0_g1_i1:111-2024(+)
MAASSSCSSSSSENSGHRSIGDRLLVTCGYGLLAAGLAKSAEACSIASEGAFLHLPSSPVRIDASAKVVRLAASTTAHQPGLTSSWSYNPVTLIPCLLVAAARRRRTVMHARKEGGAPAGVLRARKRLRQSKFDLKYGREDRNANRPDRNQPPPATLDLKTGAWKEGGRPESEKLRQGQYRSPYTDQVYDRYAPIGQKQKSTDRQGGLGRARANETPQQRHLRQEKEEADKDVPEWQKYMPGMVPPHELPASQRKTGSEMKLRPRYAYGAGNFRDFFYQIVVQTVIDLKVKKSEKPIWYVEPCGGEGEYHVNRLTKKGEARSPLLWPQSEDLYYALKGQDLTFMPPEIKGWMDTVEMLNSSHADFEVRGEDSALDPAYAGTQWLPSTAAVALKMLRKTDPVSLFENHPVSFASLLNFVRNWTPKFQAHIELTYGDGFKTLWKRYVQRKKNSISKTHGDIDGRRGVVFIDPDWNRGNIDTVCKKAFLELRRSWMAATVMMTYPLSPDFEHKAQNFNQQLKRDGLKLDLLAIEFYVENKDYDPDGEVPKWRGGGVLISMPPHTTATRVEAALEVVIKELSKSPDAHPMRIRTEVIEASHITKREQKRIQRERQMQKQEERKKKSEERKQEPAYLPGNFR